MNEKCAVVGIFGHKEASKLAYFSLHALQHRGQEAAGISSADGIKLHTIKDRGLVMSVFDEKKLETLKGKNAIQIRIRSIIGVVFFIRTYILYYNFKIFTAL